MKRSIDEPRGFIERVRPAYDGLFQCAYVLTGNLELAEYVLRSALLAAYLRRGEWRERMSFQEGVLRAAGRGADGTQAHPRRWRV